MLMDMELGAKITYSLGNVYIHHTGKEFRKVFITVGRISQVPFTQVIELPKKEAERVVRVLQANLY